MGLFGAQLQIKAALLHTCENAMAGREIYQTDREFLQDILKCFSAVDASVHWQLDAGRALPQGPQG